MSWWGVFVDRMICGHPKACMVCSDEGTCYCECCEREARLKRAVLSTVDTIQADMDIVEKGQEYMSAVYAAIDKAKRE